MSTHTVLQFKHAIESIDSLSQLGFSRISSIAKLALMALESPEQYLRTPADIRNALKAIADTACDFENCINSLNEVTLVTLSCDKDFILDGDTISAGTSFIENEIEDNFHFGKSIIERINQDGNHEVGTHTYSHYNCSEEGQTKEQFYEDLKSAKNIAKNSKVNLQSIVFPKNQIKTEYLKICKEMGILSYRGNEKSVIYNLSLKNYNKYLIKLMRLVRIADSYFNITGHNTYSQKSLINAEVELINIPSSRFLRPHNKSLSLFESFKRKRIIRSMKHAAKKNKVFHLWWHPHNFGSNIEENFYNLEEILKEYKKLNNKYDFKSMTMTNLTLGILK